MSFSLSHIETHEEALVLEYIHIIIYQLKLKAYSTFKTD